MGFSCSAEPNSARPSGSGNSARESPKIDHSEITIEVILLPAPTIRKLAERAPDAGIQVVKAI
jgi:hypothetical protein